MKKKLFNIIFKLFYKLYMKAKRYEQDSIYNYYRNRYRISNTFKFNGESIIFKGDGDIVCGSNSYVGRFSILSCSEGKKIQIGDNCRIAQNVRMNTKTTRPFHFKSEIKPYKEGDIIIEDDVWIGINTYIGPNVRIGYGSTIGSNSVVVKDVPSLTVVGGVPAKIIKKYE